ncbi:hypothetical protein N7532_001338 [Penicillium argentinense]|uniref:N-acetyltransferase ESCO zinc-finger domain-containing protein n=1 Tax=Penicillium argentinense TaxID=1131581 RepID=A0A9W9KMC3_9EURO|nr:uncharacterized protein N7532_001338 [Penicillium argentinense]KAJ5110803.1 hypothetical protein N7532_001338 [Penicillium argentinense]
MPWTVTNSFKRRVQDETDEAETNLQYAIRESSAAVLSSPSRRNSVVLSEGTLDDIDDLTTPPSSPPPRLTPPPANARKPTFAFLKRKHNKDVPAGSPLTEVNSNSVRSSVDEPKHNTKAAAQQKQPALRQMQIDLGNEVRKTCATCGMEYIPSNTEDAALHKSSTR